MGDNPRAVGVQRIGLDLRDEMAHSHLKDFTKTRGHVEHARTSDDQVRTTKKNVSRRLSRGIVMGASLHKRQEQKFSQHPATQKKRNPGKVREVFTIIGGPHVAGDNHSTHDKYTKEVRKTPQPHMHERTSIPPGALGKRPETSSSPN